MFLRKATAVNVPMGPFVSSTDGDTEYASTLAAGDVFLFKEGGTTMGAKAETTNPTAMSKGFFYVMLNTVDTGTSGSLLIAVHKAATLVAWKQCFVLEAVVYDALFANTGAGIRSASQSLANGSLVAATFGAGAIDANAIATDALGSLELATSAVTEITDAIRTNMQSWLAKPRGLAATQLSSATGTFIFDSTALNLGNVAVGNRVAVIAGPGRGQVRRITGWTAGSRTGTVSPDWKYAPGSFTEVNELECTVL